MGILDDLKKQAQETRSHQESEAERQARLEENYQHQILPKMRAIIQYLYDMREQLEIVKLETAAIYKLPVIGPTELLQGVFTINLDNNDHPKKIGLAMECTAAEQQTYPVNSPSSANELRAFLDKQGVQYTEWAIRDKNDRVVGANFEGRVKVKTRMLFQANIDHSRIDLMTANFETLGAKKMTFNTDQIDDEWLDELGHYLLRKEAKLGSLDIADHQKEFIKTQLVQYEEQRRKELEEAASHKAEPESEDKLIASLRKTLNKPLW